MAKVFLRYFPPSSQLKLGVNFGKLIQIFMENKEPQKNKFQSVKEFFVKPIIKTDSSFVQYSGLGIQLAVTIIVFLFGGIWLDKYFETKFIFTLICVFLGFVGVIYKLISVVKELEIKNKENVKK